MCFLRNLFSLLFISFPLSFLQEIFISRKFITPYLLWSLTPYWYATHIFLTNLRMPFVYYPNLPLLEVSRFTWRPSWIRHRCRQEKIRNFGRIYRSLVHMTYTELFRRASTYIKLSCNVMYVCKYAWMFAKAWLRILEIRTRTSSWYSNLRRIKT